MGLCVLFLFAIPPHAAQRAMVAVVVFNMTISCTRPTHEDRYWYLWPAPLLIKQVLVTGHSRAPPLFLFPKTAEQKERENKTKERNKGKVHSTAVPACSPPPQGASSLSPCTQPWYSARTPRPSPSFAHPTGA